MKTVGFLKGGGQGRPWGDSRDRVAVLSKGSQMGVLGAGKESKIVKTDPQACFSIVS